MQSGSGIYSGYAQSITKPRNLAVQAGFLGRFDHVDLGRQWLVRDLTIEGSSKQDPSTLDYKQYLIFVLLNLYAIQRGLFSLSIERMDSPVGAQIASILKKENFK